MSEEDFKRITAIVKEHRSSCGSGGLLLLFVLFLNGCFKGCGY